MEGKENPESYELFRKYVEAQGYDPDAQRAFRLTLTKKITLEPIIPGVELEDCMPPSLAMKQGTCPLCQKDYKLHAYMDYFMKPWHTNAILNFFMFLKNKHKKSKKMYQKLGIEAPDSVLSIRGMIELMVQMVAKSLGVAPHEMPIGVVDWLQQVFQHYVPSEQEKYESQTIARKVTEAKIRYSGFCDKYRGNFMIHRRYVDLTENDVEAYDSFVKRLGEQAENNYDETRKNVHDVASSVVAYEKQAEDFARQFQPLKTAVMESIRRRREKSVAPSFLITPTGKAKKSGKR